MKHSMTALQPLREAIENALDRYTSATDGCPARLLEAIRYSVLAPGKRLRPLLTLLACKAVGGQWEAAIPAACAVEFIHVYSLIHDDLPAMDNDSLRRGRATCHIEFDEATAILAGDSLQMLAVETICNNIPADLVVRCCQILTLAAGRGKLVGGQVDDLAAEGRFGRHPEQGLPALEFLKSIHRRKTSALIEASLQLGAVVGGGNSSQQQCLADYGSAIGLAFQIIDDCLDVEGTAERLGKNTRKDCSRGKLTYPSLMGLDPSRAMAQQLICDACEAVAGFGKSGEHLTQIAQFVVDRSF